MSQAQELETRLLRYYDRVFAEFSLDSPRSLRACGIVGVDPKELLRGSPDSKAADVGTGAGSVAEARRLQKLAKCVVARATLIYEGTGDESASGSDTQP